MLAQSLLPSVVELASDKQWRVRLAIIESIPRLGAQLGIQYFDERMTSLCMEWLGDCVFSIREAATKNLFELIKVFGVDWAKERILPRIIEMASHQHYLFRMTTIQAITVS